MTKQTYVESEIKQLKRGETNGILTEINC